MKAISIVAVALAAGGCGAGKPISFVEVGRGQQSGVDAFALVPIRSEDAWHDYRSGKWELKEVPVDWSKEELLAVHLGRRMSGGHELSVESVSETWNGSRLVRLIEREPTEGATMALTSPFVVVKVPRFSGGYRASKRKIGQLRRR